MSKAWPRRIGRRVNGDFEARRPDYSAGFLIAILRFVLLSFLPLSKSLVYNSHVVWFHHVLCISTANHF